jgi:hypothetical protein
MSSGWTGRVRASRVDDDTAKYFDRVARVRLDPIGSPGALPESILCEVARELWMPEHGSEWRLTMRAGHTEHDAQNAAYCARGIVGRKDASFVVISCGGLLWLAKSAEWAAATEVEDLVALIVEPV